MQYTEVMDRIDGRLGPQYTLDQCVQHSLQPPTSYCMAVLIKHDQSQLPFRKGPFHSWVLEIVRSLDIHTH